MWNKERNMERQVGRRDTKTQGRKYYKKSVWKKELNKVKSKQANKQNHKIFKK